MRLIFLLVAAILSGAAVSAQSGQPSSAASTPQDAPTVADQDAPARDLPVSLDRIRQLLADAPANPLIGGSHPPPDFRVTVEERRFLLDILETLDVKTEPAPPGGLYANEIQQQFWNTRNSPLGRPYAAYTSSELVQVSLTSILSALVMRYMTDSVKAMSRSQAEAAAHEEVQRAIAEYCGARPDRAFIDLCTMPSLRR